MTDKLMTPSEVRERVRLSETSLYRLRRKGKFPSPIVLGERKHAWRESEVNAWLASRTRGQGSLPPKADAA